MCLKQTKNTTFLITQVRKRHPKDIFDTSLLQPQDDFMKTAKKHFKNNSQIKLVCIFTFHGNFQYGYIKAEYICID